jgi:hypothetical protein
MSQHKGKIIAGLILVFILFYAVSVYWSVEPSRVNVITQLNRMRSSVAKN